MCASHRAGAPGGQQEPALTGHAPARTRLTDQALVAAAAGRQSAAAEGREPSAADLLVGLAAEPDGAAGGLLRAQPSAASRLLERASGGPAGLPSMASVIERAAAQEAPRPAPTRALLAALLELGAAGVVELISSCGYDPSQLYRAATEQPTVGTETFGLGSDPDLSPEAATAVARVRAAAGGAVELVLAIAATPAGEELLPLDDRELAALGSVLGDEERAAGGGWDRGLGTVLDTVRAWRDPPLGVRDLLRAAVVSGGDGPRRLVEEAARHAPQDDG